MFIIMIGLVGVSSLVYVGRHEVQEGGRLDRAANLGRAAINDIRIRGMLGPRFQPVTATPTLLRSEVWAVGSVPLSPLVYNTTNGLYRYDVQTNPNPAISTAPPPYVIDPLGVAAGFGAIFPLGALPLGVAPDIPANKPPLGLIRLTTVPAGLTDAQRAALTQPQLQSLADDVFRGQDDIVATFRPGTQNPATQQYTISGSAPIKRQSAGEYTWLATLVPKQTSEFTNNLMTVSVAVFHKRKLSIGGIGEKAVFVKGFYSGGSPIQAVLYSSAAADLNVKPGQWLMLNGAAPKTNPMPSNPTIADYRLDHKWYRIINVDDFAEQDPNLPTAPLAPYQPNGSWIRNVTLVGPDWDASTVMTQASDPRGPLGLTTSAYLFDGIIGVYEKAMRLEAPSEWTSY